MQLVYGDTVVWIQVNEGKMLLKGTNADQMAQAEAEGADFVGVCADRVTLGLRSGWEEGEIKASTAGTISAPPFPLAFWGLGFT